MLRMRTLPAGFIAPCLPIKTDTLPSGGQWLHEIKHDGFRVIARKNGAQVRLYSRPGNDLTHRFPLIVETLARLRSRSCIIDGEAVACDDNGIASFNLIRYRRHDDSTFLYAFDLIELNGDDLRRDPPVLCNQYFCLRLPKKSHSLLLPIRRIIHTRGHSCADPRPSCRLGRLNSVGLLCTPTLIRPDNEREGCVIRELLRRAHPRKQVTRSRTAVVPPFNRGA